MTSPIDRPIGIARAVRAARRRVLHAWSEVNPTSGSLTILLEVAPSVQSMWSPRRASSIMLDGLISLRMISKARPCAKLVGMIDADRVPTRHVTGSLQIVHIVHDDLTSTTS